MATVNPTITRDEGSQDGSLYKITWNLTSTNDVGAAFPYAEWADKTFSVAVTAAGSATATIQGSNNNVEAEFATLHNARSGAALQWTSGPQCESVNQNPNYVRPKLTTPGSGADWTFTLSARRANPMRT